MKTAWKFFIASLFFLAVQVHAIKDISLAIEDGDEAIPNVWPDLQQKPSKAARGCRDDLFKLTGVKREAQFLYDSQYLSFCRFNEYRLSMYMECVKTLNDKIKTMTLQTIPSFCNHAQNFSKNEYRNYTGCLAKIYANTDLYGGFVSSVCEQSKGKESIVDCVISAIGRGRNEMGSPQQLQSLDECMTK